MQTLDEMLLGASMLLSVIALALIAVVWRRIEAGKAMFSGVPEALGRIGREIDFPPPAPSIKSVASTGRDDKGAHVRQSALAGRIMEFSQALGRWCDTAGDTPVSGALQERQSTLADLQRDAMSDGTLANTAWMQFAKHSAEIVKAVLSATDKDFADAPHREELEKQLMVLVEVAELALIDPTPGTQLDRERHEPRGGSAGGQGHARETITGVLSRGLERPSAPKDSRARVLMKAEVRVNY